MSSAVGAVLVLVFLGTLGFLGLYFLIKRETNEPTVIDRETAEREAREQGGTVRRGDSDRKKGK